MLASWVKMITSIYQSESSSLKISPLGETVPETKYHLLGLIEDRV